MQRRKTELLARVYVRAVVEQEAHGRQIAHSRRGVHRHHANLIARAGVDVGAALDHLAGQLIVAKEDGQSEKREAVCRERLEVAVEDASIAERGELRQRELRAALDEELRELGIPVVHREENRRDVVRNRAEQRGIFVE